MVIEVVFEVVGQLGQGPSEDVAERLRLEVEIEEVYDVAVPQSEVVLPS